MQMANDVDDLVDGREIGERKDSLRGTDQPAGSPARKGGARTKGRGRKVSTVA